MTRFVPGAVLPVPAVVPQRQALLPDGTIDPAAETDCGEACLASVLEAASGFALSPGCIRQALGIGEVNGRTVANQVAAFLIGMGVEAFQRHDDAALAWNNLGELRHHGKYQVLLGYWLEFPALHWVLAYERTSNAVRVMDPWHAVHTTLLQPFFRDRYAGDRVVAQLS